jgi:hypothetical protein
MNANQTVMTFALLCLASASGTFAQQNTDQLKQRVLAQAQSISADDYAFTRTVRTEQTSVGGKTEKKVIVERFDPTKPAGERWILVSVDGAAPSADALSRFQKESAKRRIVPGYHRLANYFGAPAVASTDARGRTQFRFAALPKGSVIALNTDVSHNSTAEASVGEANGAPFVEQVRMAVKPMRLKLVMRLDLFESTARYRVGPEGKPLLMEQISDMAGGGMGMEGKMHTEATYSDYRLVGHKR